MKGWSCAGLVLAVGCGGVQSSKDAPFELGPKRALWSQGDSEDEALASAILVLANEDVACSVFEGKNYIEAVQAIIAKGDGMGMAFEAYASQGSVVGELTGLWTEEGGQALEEPYAQDRYLSPFAWREGFVMGIGGSSESWVQLDEVGEKVTGEFRTDWWWGRFKAEACAPFDAGTGTTGTTTVTSTF